MFPPQPRRPLGRPLQREPIALLISSRLDPQPVCRATRAPPGFATPSTDAALSNLPPAQAGAGAGIYKMASSLGSAIGAALSLTIFTSFLGGGVTIVGELLQTQGIQSNAAVRQSGMITFLFNLVLTLIAVISILVTIPKGRKYSDE